MNIKTAKKLRKVSAPGLDLHIYVAEIGDPARRFEFVVYPVEYQGDRAYKALCTTTNTTVTLGVVGTLVMAADAIRNYLDAIEGRI